MLKKLVKYDLLWIEKYTVYYFTAILLFSLLAKFTNGMADRSIAWLITDKIVSNVCIAAMVSYVINTVMRCFGRFRRNLFKDEAYLTHTLPVEKGTLYNAKVISCVTTFIISLLFVLLNIVLIFINKETLSAIKSFFAAENMQKTVIRLCILVVLQLICFLLAVFAGIELGYRKNNAKIFFSVLFSAGIYFCIQLILVGIVFLCSLIDGDFRLLFTENISSFSEFAVNSATNKLMTVSLCCYTVFDIMLYFLGRKILSRGVNVD